MLKKFTVMFAIMASTSALATDPLPTADNYPLGNFEPLLTGIPGVGQCGFDTHLALQRTAAPVGIQGVFTFQPSYACNAEDIAKHPSQTYSLRIAGVDDCGVITITGLSGALALEIKDYRPVAHHPECAAAFALNVKGVVDGEAVDAAYIESPQ